MDTRGIRSVDTPTVQEFRNTKIVVDILDVNHDTQRRNYP